MTEWRWRRGWSEAELEAAIARVDRDDISFQDSLEEMTPERGWNLVRSDALIAREAAGPPVPSGAFERARVAVERFEFSDPRIVVGHFDPEVPLAERVLLLELKPTGLRFLCPVRIGAVREESEGRCSTFGYSFETLAGHVEMGREWFLLTKDHETGEVSFRIAASWRAGEFPNLWSWAGFQLLGRRYQRAWHRLAHLRLRRLIHQAPLPSVEGEHLRHSGTEIHTAPVQFLATRAHLPFRRIIDVESEDLRRDRLALTASFAALSGMRSLTPPAFLAHGLYRDGVPESDPILRQLGSRMGARLTMAMAVGELIADKTPFIPKRTSLPALLGRTFSGALSGYALAAKGSRSRVRASLVGAAVAFGATFGAYEARRRLGARIGNIPAGLLGDLLTVGGAGVLLARLRRPAHVAPPSDLAGPSAIEEAHPA